MTSQTLWHVEFSRALLNPELACPQGLVAWNGSDPLVRLAVYRNNVVVSLVNALASSFTVTQALVGEAFFRDMARDFVQQQPPTTRVLTWMGLPIDAFIENYPPARSLPFLPDVARLEMARVQAYHAADAAPLGGADFADLMAHPEQLSQTALALHPCVHIIDSEWAVASLWGAHQGVGELADLDANVPESALVYREGLSVRVLRITAAQSEFFKALIRGGNLFDAANLAFDASHAPDDGQAFDLSATLALMISAGLACQFLPWFEKETP